MDLELTLKVIDGIVLMYILAVYSFNLFLIRQESPVLFKTTMMSDIVVFYGHSIRSEFEFCVELNKVKVCFV